MLATSVRARPWRERASRSSLARSTTTVLVAESERAATPSGRSRVRVPFGPFTVMAAPETDTSTPLGTWTADLPMRDMRYSPVTTRST
jgi:hypothetical protein